MKCNVTQESISKDGDVPLGYAALKLSPTTMTISHKQKFKKPDFSTISQPTKDFMHQYFPGISSDQWNNWRWQVQNSITSFKDLSRFIDLADIDGFETLMQLKRLPLRITPYYASLLAISDKNHPIRKGIVPSLYELKTSEGEASDPLHEEDCSPVPHLVHRYPDRVLFLVSGFCSTYCRYCTRSHMVAKEKIHYGYSTWEPAIEYIRNNKQVRDVIISGGDPLTMSDQKIEYLLSSLRSIPHVEMIRIGTKVPAVLPQRITNDLIKILKKYHPLYMSLHFMHPYELTSEVREACTRLADAGIPLGSQTVLLKGINDDVDTMKSLMHGLLMNRVRPYYIYQCDPIPGSAHFRTSVSKGLEIIKGLRGFTSGYAVPHYVIDAPGGGGKIPLLPEYYIGKEGNNIILQNFEGRRFKYPDNPEE